MPSLLCWAFPAKSSFRAPNLNQAVFSPPGASSSTATASLAAADAPALDPQSCRINACSLLRAMILKNRHLCFTGADRRLAREDQLRTAQLSSFYPFGHERVPAPVTVFVRVYDFPRFPCSYTATISIQINGPRHLHRAPAATNPWPWARPPPVLRPLRYLAPSSHHHLLLHPPPHPLYP